MGRVLTAREDDCPEVAGNLRKARKSWMWITMILSREGGDPKVSLLLFKVVVQELFLFWGIDVGPDPPDEAGPGQIP